MLLKRYRTRFVRPPNPSAQHLRCFAELAEDIGEVLPYLNTRLHGHEFCPDPPSLTLKHQGKMITLTSREIAINMVKDQEEALALLEWFQQEINTAWEGRAEIVPSFTVAAPPRVLEILKLLPRTNCRACGVPTCMVFAVAVSQGGQSPGGCPGLDQDHRQQLAEYLKKFQLPQTGSPALGGAL
jgi:ArsR family metal-binding transcriptional regulator